MNFRHDVGACFRNVINDLRFQGVINSIRDLLHIIEKNGDIPKNDSFTMNHDIVAK